MRERNVFIRLIMKAAPKLAPSKGEGDEGNGAKLGAE